MTCIHGEVERQFTLNGNSSISSLLSDISKSVNTTEHNIRLWHNKIVVTDCNDLLYKYTEFPFHVGEFSTSLAYIFDVLLVSFDIEYKQQIVSEKLDNIQGSTYPPSTYASIISKKLLESSVAENLLAFGGSPLCHHRGQTPAGSHVTLYYRGFFNFINDCEKITIDHNDCRIALALCQSMSSYYNTEKDRIQAFVSAINPIFPTIVNTTGTNPDLFIERACLFEVKNEVGSGNCDSYRECLAYYIARLDKLQLPCPSFLVELVGPNLIISGAVFGEGVYVDRLVPPLWLVMQPLENAAMIRVARTLKALAKACHELYSRRGHPHPPQSLFPEFHEFNDSIVTYIETIQRNIFRGIVDGKSVIVKFCQTYGHTVHESLATAGLAPKLLHCKCIGMFTAVVMDDVTDAVTVDEYLKDNPDSKGMIHEQCTNVLKILKDKQFVHGDLRCVNVLVKSGFVQVIDFDWAGSANEAKYPFFMNHDAIRWPDGVEDGGSITHEHDEHWIELLFS